MLEKETKRRRERAGADERPKESSAVEVELGSQADPSEEREGVGVEEITRNAEMHARERRKFVSIPRRREGTKKERNGDEREDSPSKTRSRRIPVRALYTF